ncbi:hypothetical protein ACSFA8_24660 [Variovorax sp. RT4R15]|uniref:hypothetical protein n=1 Tax=Variovorax sp. RT4R15 TaxID=3443737 RepID=UPI003F47AB12
MTSPTLPELKDLFLVAREYIQGKETIAGLNGTVGRLRALAEERGVPISTQEVLADWTDMISRRWNEWGLVRDPLTENEFVSWLQGQFVLEEHLSG